MQTLRCYCLLVVLVAASFLSARAQAEKIRTSVP